MSKALISVQKAFRSKKVIKVITGLANVDIDDVIKKVKAAEIAGVTYVDIAAHPDLVSLVKSITSIPICVSSINPRDLHRCVVAGADMVEIGNFDLFYSENIIFSYDQIIKIAQETRCLLKNSYICVTIPHNLLLEKQLKLAQNLQQIGINYVQTEGFSSKNTILHEENSAIFKSINRSSLALSSSYSITNSISIPVIAASGINALSAPIAMSYGASGVALGSVLNNLNSINDISSYIQEVVESINYYSSKQIYSIKCNPMHMRYYNKLCCN